MCCDLCFVCLSSVGCVLITYLSFMCCDLCFVFLCPHTTQKAKMTSNTDPPQTKIKRTTQKTKMISNTDPPQTKTKHTTQKTKMTCVFCFSFWGSVFLVILVFCVVCFVFVCGGSVLLIILVFCVVRWTPHKQKQNKQHRKLK
jgi:Flp pilus assembly protein TadB